MTIEQDLVYVDHEVPALPDGWKVTTLEELISENGLFCDGDWVESKDQDPSGDVRLIQLADIGVGSYRDRSDRYLTSERASALSCSFLERGDILVARMPDPLGRACIFPGDKRRAVTVVDVAIVRPNNPEVNNRWLMHRINSMAFRNAVASLQSGSTRLRISRKNLARIAFPLPPLVEQLGAVEEIEKQFSRLDEAVANLQRVKANLKRYKASVLKAAVEGRLVETEASIAQREGRSYETGEQLLQRILEERRAKWTGKGKYKEPITPLTDELPKLPEGWTWATMPQLGELNRGKSKHRPRDDQALYGGPYPFIQTGDVRRSDGSIKEFTQTYSEFGLAQSRLWPAGTLCITIAANIAETGILKLQACFPDSVVGFIPYQGSPTVEYVECFIRTARDRLDRFASATAQKNINLEVLEAVAIPTPPLAEQARIVAEVDRHLSIIREVEAEVDTNLHRAQALRESVLQKSFQPCVS